MRKGSWVISRINKPMQARRVWYAFEDKNKSKRTDEKLARDSPENNSQDIHSGRSATMYIWDACEDGLSKMNHHRLRHRRENRFDGRKNYDWHCFGNQSDKYADQWRATWTFGSVSPALAEHVSVRRIESKWKVNHSQYDIDRWWRVHTSWVLQARCNWSICFWHFHSQLSYRSKHFHQASRACQQADGAFDFELFASIVELVLID